MVRPAAAMDRMQLLRERPAGRLAEAAGHATGPGFLEGTRALCCQVSDPWSARVGGVGVVVAVLVDADRGVLRVAHLVEGDRTGDAVVVGGATVLDDLGAVGEGGALLALTGATGDLL